MILLLAGTAEARALATALAEAGVPALASLAGATARPQALDLPTRIGGFGGAAGFVAVLEAEGISAVIDATHPFARRITERTATLCAWRDLPLLRLERPGWAAGPGDRWTWFEDPEEVAALTEARAVFLATGRQDLDRYAGLAGRRVWCRQIDPPDGPFPFAGGEFVIGRPPFGVADEEALFARLGVEALVVKDAGGAASRTKLDAARALGLPVLIQRRPPAPDTTRVETVEAAMDWVRAL